MARYIDSDYLVSHCKSIISDEWNNKTAPHSWAHAYSDFIADIDDTPTADVAPVVHGRWDKVHEVLQFQIYRCNICGRHELVDEKARNVVEEFPYCPNCGCRMDLDGGVQN